MRIDGDEASLLQRVVCSTTERADRVSVFARIRSASGQRLGSLLRGREHMVPAAVLPDSELIHLGGGEMVPCPGVEVLPLAPAALRLGLGSASLALPAAKVHVLHDAVLCPGSRIVRDRAGRIVAESVTSEMSGRLPIGEVEQHLDDPIEVDGTIALFRSPWHPVFHTLIEHLPRAALLSQPVMHRVGPITLVHDGPLHPMEQLLLPRLLGHQVTLREVEPWRPLRAERVLLPGYVTRPAAGAIPSWYRRWVDRFAAGLGTGGADPDDAGVKLPRRIFVDRTHGHRKVLNRRELDVVLETHGIEALDLSKLTPEQLVRCFRDADLIVGVTGGGLAHSLFSRSARMVELVPGADVLPHFFYLCASKGLPYEHVLAPRDNLKGGSERRLRQDVFVDTGALDRVLTRSG